MLNLKLFFLALSVLPLVTSCKVFRMKYKIHFVCHRHYFYLLLMTLKVFKSQKIKKIMFLTC